MSKSKELILLLLFIAILFVVSLIIMIAISFDLSIKKIGIPVFENEDITDEDHTISNKIKNSIVHLWGCGTGFIYKEDKDNIYILTNKHVVELYNLQKHKETEQFKNRLFLPYIKFIDPNIKYIDAAQKVEINKEEFSKQKYLNDITKSIKDNSIEERMFGKFYTDQKHDIAIVTISKTSLNISENHTIQAVKFAEQSLQVNESAYVFGNVGGLCISPILTKGKITLEINPLTAVFTNRDEGYLKSNIKIYGGQSGSPTFNNNGEVVGMATFDNSVSFKLPLINYQVEMLGNNTYSIKNKIILSSLEKIYQNQI